MGIKANYTIKVPTATEFLESIGKSKDDFIHTKNRGGVFDVIHAFGVKFASDLAKKLNELNDIDTGKLIESFDFEVKRFGTNYVWQFSLLDYYKWLDKGSKPGKFPWDSSKGVEPLGKGNVLYHWVKRNNYLMTGEGVPKKKITNQKTLAYLIGRKIKLKGRKGNDFFTSTVKDGRIDKLTKDLSKALKSEVVINIKEYVKEIKKK